MDTGVLILRNPLPSEFGGCAWEGDRVVSGESTCDSLVLLLLRVVLLTGGGGPRGDIALLVAAEDDRRGPLYGVPRGPSR